MTIEGNRKTLFENKKESDRCCDNERNSAEGVVLYPYNCDKSLGYKLTGAELEIPLLQSFDELCVSENFKVDMPQAGSTETQIQVLNGNSQQNNSNNSLNVDVRNFRRNTDTCGDSCRLNMKACPAEREEVRIQSRKTVKVDGSIDNGGNRYSQNNNRHSCPGVHRVKLSERHSVKASIDMPVTDNCAVHYIKNYHSNNGKTRQSITATFVQDRTRDRQSKQPHSIVRSMDVPPPTVVHTPSSNNNNIPYHMKTSSSVRRRPIGFPITKRQQAFHAVVALQKNSNFKHYNSSRMHSRSKSGSELDFKHIVIPVPLPRNLSNASSHKPVPLPRRRLQGRSETGSAESNSWMKPSLHQTVSAPTTPVDSTRSFPTASIVCSIVEESIKENQSSNIIHKENIQSQKLPSMTEEVESSSKHRSGKSSADNISASTVLSWV